MNHIDEEIFQRYLDQRLSAKEAHAVTMHISLCQQCAHEVELFRMTDASLRTSVVSEQAPISFSIHVMRNIARQATNIGVDKSIKRLFALLMTLLSCCGVGGLWYIAQTSTPGTGVPYLESIRKTVHSFFPLDHISDFHFIRDDLFFLIGSIFFLFALVVLFERFFSKRLFRY